MAEIKNIQTTFSLPSSFNAEQRLLAGRMIIDKIQNNTSLGKDRYGQSFPRYSAEYRTSLDFENAGKSSRVNLQLTGDMLISLEIIKHSQGSITIGYPSGHPDSGKVEGNVIGSYGGDPNPSKARPFIGLPQRQLDLIIARVRNEHPETTEKRSAVDGLINSLLSRFGV